MKVQKYTAASSRNKIIYFFKMGEKAARTWYSTDPCWFSTERIPYPGTEYEEVSWLEVLLVTGLTKRRALLSDALEKQKDVLERSIWDTLNPGYAYLPGKRPNDY